MLFDNTFKLLIENYDVMYFWLKPDGTVVEFKGTHYAYASKITKSLDPLTTLFQQGWQRVNQYGTSIFSNNSIMRPNIKQIRELKNQAIERNLNEIYWDNDYDARIIWSREQ